MAEQGGNITESQQFGDPATGLFFMRVQVELTTGREALMAGLAALASRFDMTWHLDEVGRALRTLLLGFTAANCEADLACRQHSRQMPIDVVGVASNHTVLQRLAEFYGYPFHHISVRTETAAQAEAKLMELVERHDVELIVLARAVQWHAEHRVLLDGTRTVVFS